MGKRDRERVERLQRGEEESISVRGLNNPLARTAVKLASRRGVVRELTKATTDQQIEVLGSTSPSKVGRAIMRKAPGEMDRGIRKSQNQSRKVTVAGLLTEVRTTPGFLSMCENAGVSYAWFERLARERMKKHGITEG